MMVPGHLASVIATSILGWIVVGLIAGGIGRWIVKDDRSDSPPMTGSKR